MNILIFVLLFNSLFNSLNSTNSQVFHIKNDLNTNIQENGLFVPYLDSNLIHRNEYQNIPDHTFAKRPDTRTVTVELEQIPIDDLLSSFLGRTNAVIHYFPYNPRVAEPRQPEFYFSLSKFENNGQTYNVLQKSTEKKSDLDVKAYWCPQGGSVVIPIRPNGDQPKYLFTPAFSGCHIAIDYVDNQYRVYHVQGGYEKNEYNDLPIEAHGEGMVASMQYKDYGFNVIHGQDVLSDTAVQNRQGMAFLQFDNSRNEWAMHYRGESYNGGMPSITSIQTTGKKPRAVVYLPGEYHVFQPHMTFVDRVTKKFRPGSVRRRLEEEHRARVELNGKSSSRRRRSNAIVRRFNKKRC